MDSICEIKPCQARAKRRVEASGTAYFVLVCDSHVVAGRTEVSRFFPGQPTTVSPIR
jgi:hypothetical protein